MLHGDHHRFKTGAVLRETSSVNNKGSVRGVYMLPELLAGLNSDNVDIRNADIGTDSSTVGTADDACLETGATRCQRSNFCTCWTLYLIAILLPRCSCFIQWCTALGDRSMFNRILFETPARTISAYYHYSIIESCQSIQGKQEKLRTWFLNQNNKMLDEFQNLRQLGISLTPLTTTAMHVEFRDGG